MNMHKALASILFYGYNNNFDATGLHFFGRD